MDSAFKIWKSSRENLLGFLDKYSLEQLNKTPSGFSNNLIWNIGHVLVVQQVLIYTNSNLEGYLPKEYYGLYKPGTKPTGKTSQEEVDQLKNLLISMVGKTESDFLNNEFKTYTEKTVGTGFCVTSVEDAIRFNNYHEGLHMGYMMNIRKFI